MSTEVDLSDMGLSREDQILARVVLDLDLATLSDIESAVEKVKESGGATLGQALQESGHLNPRFLSVVEKVVKSRLAATRSKSSRRRAQSPTDAESKQVLPSLAPPVQRARAEPAGDIAEAAFYKQAPRGENFSARSKEDVASAWAAYHERSGGKSPVEAPEAQDAGAGPPEAAEAPKVADERPGGGARHGFRRAKRKNSTGITDSIDLNALKEELGIEGGRSSGAKDPEAVPSDPQQKDIALRAFIERVVPSRLHQQCLETLLRRRLGTVSAARLKQECGCREREAKRVLETWRSAGIVRQGSDEYEILQYQFTPSKADLALIREFMVMWESPQTHNRLLGWILEHE